MYTECDAMFIYAVSPVHMGAGTAFGAIDSPIQRERHTAHPMMAGSGVKGALRHYLSGQTKEDREAKRPMIEKIFGPENTSDGAAGAVSFSDGQLVLFPVRSLRHSFVYATCPTALARLKRLLALAGMDILWKIPECQGDECIVLPQGELTSGDGQLVLEAYEFKATHRPGSTPDIAKWIAEKALPHDEAYDYFQKKLAKHLVVLSDDRFNYFVRNATVVEAHVRIDDESGTASDKGLFYVENLPPESLMISLVMASGTRSREGNFPASKVIGSIRKGQGEMVGLAGKMVQFGGDANIGRGQAVLSFVKEDANG